MCYIVYQKVNAGPESIGSGVEIAIFLSPLD